MTKRELVDEIQSLSGIETKAETEKALDSLLEAMTEELSSGGKVTLTGFGTFTVTERAERTGRNPQTGQPMRIPAHKAVKFSAGSELKETVAQGRVPDWLDHRRFTRNMRKQMDQMKTKVDRYMRDKDRLSGETKRYAEKASDLYDDASKRLKEVSGSSGKAWKELRKGFEGAYRELRESLSKAWQKF